MSTRSLTHTRKGKGEGGQLMFWLSQLLSLLGITLCQINLVLLNEALLSQLTPITVHKSLSCSNFTGSETQGLLEFLKVQNVKT